MQTLSSVDDLCDTHSASRTPWLVVNTSCHVMMTSPTFVLDFGVEFRAGPPAVGIVPSEYSHLFEVYSLIIVSVPLEAPVDPLSRVFVSVKFQRDFVESSGVPEEDGPASVFWWDVLMDVSVIMTVDDVIPSNRLSGPLFDDKELRGKRSTQFQMHNSRWDKMDPSKSYNYQSTMPSTPPSTMIYLRKVVFQKAGTTAPAAMAITEVLGAGAMPAVISPSTT